MLHLSACYTWLGCAIFYLPYIQSFRQFLLLIGIQLFTISYFRCQLPQVISFVLLLSKNIQFSFPMLHSMSLDPYSTLCLQFPPPCILNCLLVLLIVLILTASLTPIHAYCTMCLIIHYHVHYCSPLLVLSVHCQTI